MISDGVYSAQVGRLGPDLVTLPTGRASPVHMAQQSLLGNIGETGTINRLGNLIGSVVSIVFGVT